MFLSSGYYHSPYSFFTSPYITDLCFDVPEKILATSSLTGHIEIHNYEKILNSIYEGVEIYQDKLPIKLPAPMFRIGMYRWVRCAVDYDVWVTQNVPLYAIHPQYLQQ